MRESAIVSRSAMAASLNLWRGTVYEVRCSGGMS